MTTPGENEDLRALLADVRQELARLNQRIAELEEKSAEPAEPAPAVETINEETVLVISAAIAAFLGKKAPIRQIRLVSSPAWQQQGRVTLQTSHALYVQHG